MPPLPSSRDNPRVVCEQLRNLAISSLSHDCCLVRIALLCHAKGKTCRLFLRHGPFGRVIERHFSGNSVVTVCEFDALAVLNVVSKKLGR